MTDKAAEQIKSYLLGELREDEVEQLEESLFIDDEVYSAVQTTEMSLVDGYVRNELPHDERTRFEGQYLVTPERRQKVSEARLFHDELNTIRPMPEVSERRVGWLERVLGNWKLPVMQYASAALILLLAISTSWLFYSDWKTRNELAMARNAFENSQTILDERLAEKERELNDRMAEQRGEDSESLSALQTEVDNLRHQLEEVKRKSSNANVSVPQSPTIATIFLPVARGGMNQITTVTVTKDTKVLNIKIPVAADEDGTFDVIVNHEGNLVMKKSPVKATEGAEGKILALALPLKAISAGKYDVVLKSNNGTEKTRSFMVAVK